MTALQELNATTKKLFEGGLEIKSPQGEDYCQALEQLGLSAHASKLKHETYYAKAKLLGLKELTILETIEMMVNSPIRRIVQLRQCPDELHQKHYCNSRGASPRWQDREFQPEQISVECENGTFHKFQVGDPDYLKSKIPYGALLLMKELKDTGIFDCFFAIAPLEFWRPGEKFSLDPVIVASVKIDGAYKHFFVAQWL